MSHENPNPTAEDLAHEIDHILRGTNPGTVRTLLRTLKAVLGFTAANYVILENMDMAANLNDLKTTLDGLTQSVNAAIALLKDVNPALVDTLNTQAATAKQQLQAAVDAASPPPAPPPAQ